MATMLALYRKPADIEAFEDHYFKTHIPLARKIPGLQSIEVSDGAVNALQGGSPYHLIAALRFESRAAIDQALASAEGRATAADLAQFAQAGVDLLVFETREV